MKNNISLDNKSEITALLYSRVSSNRQKNEGHGLDSQEHRCREFAQEQGWEIIEEGIFRDDFTGGGDFMRRPAMRALIDYIDNHPHKKFVIVFDDFVFFFKPTM
jgi:DNA invertase Pin-like site-specific DNA recombinase